jgi:hypothetical protein
MIVTCSVTVGLNGHSVHYLQSPPQIALHLYSCGSHCAHGTLGSLLAVFSSHCIAFIFRWVTWCTWDTWFISYNLLLKLHCIYIQVGHMVHMGHLVHYLQSPPQIVFNLYSGGSHGARGTLGSLLLISSSNCLSCGFARRQRRVPMCVMVNLSNSVHGQGRVPMC